MLWWIFVLIIIFAVVSSYSANGKKNDKKDFETYCMVTEKIEAGEEISEKEFNDLIDACNYHKDLKPYDFEGVYILHHLKTNTYFVGKASHVPTKIKQHFEGNGNQEVYKAYKKGEFGIRLKSLENSMYSNIDELKKHYIEFYKAMDI